MDASVTIKSGTISGTILSVLPNIFSEDILRTVLLATVGAIVSFTVTLILKWFSNRKKKKSG